MVEPGEAYRAENDRLPVYRRFRGAFRVAKPGDRSRLHLHGERHRGAVDYGRGCFVLHRVRHRDCRHYPEGGSAQQKQERRNRSTTQYVMMNFNIKPGNAEPVHGSHAERDGRPVERT